MKYKLSAKITYWCMGAQKMFFCMFLGNHFTAYFTFFKIPGAVGIVQVNIRRRNVSVAENIQVNVNQPIKWITKKDETKIWKNAYSKVKT